MEFMQISMFMKGITNNCRRMVNASTGGNYLNKTTTQVKTIIKDLVASERTVEMRRRPSNIKMYRGTNRGGFQNIHRSYNQVGDNKPQQRPNLWDRILKLEEDLTKLIEVVITNHKNIQAAIKSMETQIGKLAKQLQTSSIGFSATIKDNPKVHCKAIISIIECDVGGKEEEEIEESTMLEQEMKAQANPSTQGWENIGLGIGKSFKLGVAMHHSKGTK
ncbi:hypothetical protein HKD37_14G040581 [Glycine soja]